MVELLRVKPPARTRSGSTAATAPRRSSNGFAHVVGIPVEKSIAARARRRGDHDARAWPSRAPSSRGSPDVADRNGWVRNTPCVGPTGARRTPRNGRARRGPGPPPWQHKRPGVRSAVRFTHSPPSVRTTAPLTSASRCGPSTANEPTPAAGRAGGKLSRAFARADHLRTPRVIFAPRRELVIRPVRGRLSLRRRNCSWASCLALSP